MGKLWILLVLIAQFAWAIQVYLDKWLVSPNDHDAEENEVGTLILISAFFNVVVVVGIYPALALLYGEKAWDMLFGLAPINILLAISVGVIEILWLIPYFYALHDTDETVAPPLFQSVPIFGLILGFFVFKETPASYQIFAAAVILSGALVLNLQSMQARVGTTIRSLFKWRAVGLMLLASFLIAFSTFVFKNAALDENYWGAAFWMAVGAVLTGCVIWVVKPEYRNQFKLFAAKRDKKRISVNITNELVNSTANLLFYWAVLLGPSTGIVQATVAYQPVLILLIGFTLAKLGSESHAVRLSGKNLALRVCGISAIVAGSLLIV